MKKKRGFTLIEMVIVIGIIFILSAVAFMGVPQYINNANTASGNVKIHADNYDTAKLQVDALGGVMGAPAPAVIPPESFLVTFVDWNTTTVLKQDTVVSGGTAVPPSNPTRTGFTFSGWNPATFTNITANMTVTAQYTADPVSPVTHTVTFKYYNGSDTLVSTPVTVNDGAAAAAPVSNPIWPGHTFSGWNPATFTNITANMTVTAQYTSNAPVQVAGVNTAIGTTENANKYTAKFTLAADDKAKILTVVLPEGAIASVWYTVSSMTQTGRILTITVASWQSSPAIYVTYSGAAAHTAIVTSIVNG